MIKCIATDLDGTLIGANKHISKENREAILKAQAAGIDVVVATGRSLQGALFPLHDAKIDCNIICMNGAQICTYNGKVLLSIEIDKEVVNKIIQVFEENDLYFELYTNISQFSSSLDKGTKTMAEIYEISYDEAANLEKMRFLHEGIQFANDYRALLSEPSIDFYKIIAYSKDENLLCSVLNKLSKYHQLSISSSEFGNIEITHYEAQKGIALEHYVSKKGISILETMAIGDSFNDISMLEKAGYSVVMGNAPEELKGAYDYVTDTNINHGFAKAVCKVLKMK